MLLFRLQWISVVLSVTLTLQSTMLNVAIHSNISYIWKHFIEKCKRLISLQHSKITINIEVNSSALSTIPSSEGL